MWDNSTVPEDLLALGTDLYSGANAISNDGSVIVGFSSATGLPGRAVRWVKVNGHWTIDPLPNSTGCGASAVSSDGTAIGGQCGNQAVVWLNGAFIPLGQGFLSDVNRNGQATGVGSDQSHAVRWTFSTLPVTVTDLGSLGGGYAYATGINDAGEITGWSGNSDGWSHAFLWSPRKAAMSDLGIGAVTSGGYDPNAAGDVVGDLWPNLVQHAALFSNGKVVDLGVLPGYASAIATAINNNGQVVGATNSSSSQQRATEWILK